MCLAAWAYGGFTELVPSLSHVRVGAAGLQPVVRGHRRVVSSAKKVFSSHCSSHGNLQKKQGREARDY